MASAITARPKFCFHLNRTKYPPHFVSSQKTIFVKPLFITSSVDISQEDKPLESNANSQEDKPLESNANSETDTLDTAQDQEQESSLDPRRLEEKFAVLNTGIYECRSCGYRYNQAVGDPSYPIAPGLEFYSLPSDWRCPTCGAAQSFFQSKSIEVAGFAQNQQFGLGGNSLTSGQKTLVIYGSLLFFFGLFLSGYFLQ